MWKELFDSSKGFSVAQIFNPSIAFPLAISDIATIITQSERDTRKLTKNYFRSYSDGLENYKLTDEILSNLKRNGDFTQSVIKDFSTRKIGLVVNGGLQWSKSTSEKISHYTALLSSVIDDVYHTIDLTFFIGDYGFTPFGVHLDDKTHSTIIFNLGPGNKQIWLWDQRAIQDQFGNVSNVIDVDRIVARPEKFTIGPGQAFVLPSTLYHVGYNNEFSITASLVLDRPKFSKFVSDEILKQEDFIDFLGSGLKRSGEFDLLHHLDRSILARVDSNNHLRYPLYPRNIYDSGISRNSLITLDKQKIRSQKISPEGSVFFSRGVSQYFMKDAGFSEFVDEFPRHSFMPVAHAIDNLCTFGHSTRDALSLLNFFYKTHSAEIK